MIAGQVNIANAEIRPLDFCYNSGKNYGNMPLPDFNSFVSWLIEVGLNISDMCLDLLGSVRHSTCSRGCPNGALQTLPQADPAHSGDLSFRVRMSGLGDGEQITWNQFIRSGMKSDASWLLPQGLYVKFSE